MLTIGVDVSQSQTMVDSWAFGFGFSYPKLSTANITSVNSNYGGYYSLQRNFSENIGLRLIGGYSHLEGEWKGTSLNMIKEKTTLLTGEFDLLYYFPSYELVLSYLFGGIGINYKKISNGSTTLPDESKFGYQLNIGAGVELKITSNWSFVTMVGYHYTNNSELDGAIAPNELNGHDSYLVLSGGVQFFFDKGILSKWYNPYQ
jgi:opacity protein-like surface antigen